VTSDGNGGLRALDTRDGSFAVVRPTGPDRALPTRGRLDFTADGILVGVPRRPGAPADLIGLRAGTWSELLVPGAPRAAGLFDAVSGIPAGGLPATDRVLPPGTFVLGLVGTPTVRAAPDSDAAAVQTNYDGTVWTVWEAASGRVERRLDEFPVAARPGAFTADGSSILAAQYHVVVRLDAATGRRAWSADPFGVGVGEPPTKLGEFLTWALGAASADPGTPRQNCDVAGVARDDDLLLVTARTPSPATPEAAPTARPNAFTCAVLDATTGATVWRRDSADAATAAWIGPGGRTVLLVEGGVARLLDVADGDDVTPAAPTTGWPGGALPVRAAAAEHAGDGLWVLLTDGHVRRLAPPK